MSAPIEFGPREVLSAPPTPALFEKADSDLLEKIAGMAFDEGGWLEAELTEEDVVRLRSIRDRVAALVTP